MADRPTVAVNPDGSAETVTLRDAPLRIAIDATGGDFAPDAPIEGALLAATELGAHVVLVGDPTLISRELERHGDIETVEIVPATGAAHADPNTRSRLVLTRACELVARGHCDALVSAARSSIIRQTAMDVLGLLPSALDAAKLAVIPSMTTDRVLIDCGSWSTPEPATLVVNARMGAAFYEAHYGKAAPRVALLVDSNRRITSPVHAAADTLLRESGLNYAGPIRGLELFSTEIDVIVADGFTGNVALASIEAVLGHVAGLTGERQRRGMVHAFRLAVSGGPLRDFSRRLNSAQLGGAPLLGVNGLVLIAQSSSDAEAVKGAIGAARALLEQDVVEAVRRGLTVMPPGAPAAG
jgi:phosphate acyltransferase